MLLYHATLRRNVASIRQRGLDPAFALQGRRAVWLHATSRTAWAVLHTVRRHGGRVEDVVVLPVRVSRRMLRRHGKGLWYCAEVIPAERIGTAIGFRVVSESEVTP